MTTTITFECEWDEAVFSEPMTVAVRAEIESAGSSAVESPPGRPDEPAYVADLQVFAINSKGFRTRVNPIPAGLYRDCEEAALARYSLEMDDSLGDIADREHGEEE